MGSLVQKFVCIHGVGLYFLLVVRVCSLCLKVCVSSCHISMLVAFQAFTVLYRTQFKYFVELCAGKFNVPLSTDLLLYLGFDLIYCKDCFMYIMFFLKCQVIDGFQCFCGRV